jgi:hypothetical protein
VITSERQFSAAKEKLSELKKNGKKAGAPTKGKSDKATGQLKDLQNDMNEYKKLRENGMKSITLKSVEDLMTLPIKYRLAKNMTQDAFALKVDMPLRMIARYEASDYKNIQGENLFKILSKLNLKIAGTIKENK